MKEFLIAVWLTGLFLIVVTPVSAQKHKKTFKTHIYAASVADGEVIYKKNCLICHQAHGGGVQRMNPPLTNTNYVLGDKTRLIKIILNGFKEEVEISGQYYSNIMPSHDFLKDQEIANVLTYVRNSFGNKASAVTPLQVKQVRESNKKI